MMLVSILLAPIVLPLAGWLGWKAGKAWNRIPLEDRRKLGVIFR